MTAPGAFAVVIPAHNEELLLGACLRSVRAALARSRSVRAGQPGRPTMIVVVAHRCTDRTVPVALDALAGFGLEPDSWALVLADDSPSVATARAAGAAAALTMLAGLPASPVGPERSWLLSTDADSTVPPTWIGDLGRHIDQGAAAVTGLVRVHGWEGASPAAREAYRAIIAAGLRLTHHDHVYAANLAVRADAYLDVGGWPDQVPGEDAALIAALRRKGWPVATATDVWVRTSGRRTPRAGGGLGSLLDRLALEGVPAVSR